MTATKKRILAVAAGVLLAAAEAGAIGTDAGVDVNNQATVNYTVGIVPQTAVNSNTATFKVDRRVLVTVAELGGAYTDVTPGAVEQVLTFTVTNDTNAPLDFELDAAQDAVGVADAFGGTDDFDVSAFSVIIDSNGSGSYESGVDAGTFLDEIPEGASPRVFIVSTIPLGQANNNTAGLTLTATAAEPGAAGLGAPVVETTIAEDPDAMDTVFGDLVAGVVDGSRDGAHSDRDAYRIQTATLAVTKTTTVVSDPFNGTTDPKRIPGAVIEYCITVDNTGTTPATSVVLTDVLTTQPVTYEPGSIVTEDGTTCLGGTSEDDDAAGGDEVPNGGSQSGGTVSGTFTTVPAGTGKALRFQVRIN